jgi:hypothetical protein
VLKVLCCYEKLEGTKGVIRSNKWKDTIQWEKEK